MVSEDLLRGGGGGVHAKLRNFTVSQHILLL